MDINLLKRHLRNVIPLAPGSTLHGECGIAVGILVCGRIIIKLKWNGWNVASHAAPLEFQSLVKADLKVNKKSTWHS